MDQTNSDTADRIRRVFVDSLALNVPAEELREIEKLNAIAGIDSLAALDFVAALEKEFGLEMEPERLNLEFLADLPALTEYIDAHRQQAD